MPSDLAVLPPDPGVPPSAGQLGVAAMSRKALVQCRDQYADLRDWTVERMAATAAIASGKAYGEGK